MKLELLLLMLVVSQKEEEGRYQQQFNISIVNEHLMARNACRESKSNLVVQNDDKSHLLQVNKEAFLSMC